MPQPNSVAGHAAPNWGIVKRVVAEALDLQDGARSGFIAAQTGGDAALRAEVESLVRAAAAPGLLTPALDAWVGLGGADLRALQGQRIGGYRLERLLAEGATAAVYLAVQDAPQRRVALKLLRAPLPLVDASGRFAREAAALGRLVHPNIARIYEAGVHRLDGGTRLPFIAMEYVEGVPITDAVRSGRLPQRAIVELLIKVASAVHAAHQQAVIHRDLKPANVLVDTAGEPRVLDFGIARVADRHDDPRLWQTTAGVLLGTPGYMSPEQAGGRLDDIDVRTDVWALGALLHELLTGVPPIDVRGATLTEALRRIETTEPLPPSRRATGISSDLDVIVVTALAREKARRYPSALALADDLTRLLRDEPIAARPPTLRYRLAKFARRHRAGLAVLAACVALLAVSGVLLTRALLDASRERDRARAVNALLHELITAADPHYGDRNVTLVTVLAAAEKRLDTTPDLRPDVEAGVRSALGTLYFGLGGYERADALLARAIDLRRPYAGRADAELLSDQARRAVVLRWRYEPEAARALAQEVYDTAHRALGPGHLTTLIAQETLAGCRHDLQDLAGAEAAYRAAVADCRRYLGEQHDQTLTTLSNLATVLTDMGQYEEAETLSRQALAMRIATSGPDTLHALTLRGNIANVLAERGHLDEALDELAHVVADAQRLLGAGHAHTLMLRSSRAELLRRSGRVVEALAEARVIFEQRVAALGWTHDRTFDACLNYTAMLLRLQRAAEAYPLALQAVQEAEQHLGPTHLWCLRHRLNLAAALGGLGDHAAAQTLYAETVTALEAALGPEHPQTLVARSNHGLCLVDAGDGPAAVAVLEPTLARVQAGTLVSMEPVVRRNLGQALHLAGRSSEAEAQLTTAYALSTQRGETENAARVATALAALYDTLGRPADAEAWRCAAQGE